MNTFTKQFILICTTAFAIFFGVSALAQDHHLARHNMILYGEKEIFASHIVYKIPHHYQIILKLEFDQKIRDIYLHERANNPKDRFILLLDTMDVGKIETSDKLSGTILRIGEGGSKTVLVPAVELLKAQFQIIFFNELPLNLGNN